MSGKLKNYDSLCRENRRLCEENADFHAELERERDKAQVLESANTALTAENERLTLKCEDWEMRLQSEAEHTAHLTAENVRLTRKRLKAALHDEAACLVATLMPLLHRGDPPLHKGDNWRECDAPVCKIATRICSQDTTMQEQLMERNRDILKTNERLTAENEELKRLMLNQKAEIGYYTEEVEELKRQLANQKADADFFKGEVAEWNKTATALRQRCEALEGALRTVDLRCHYAVTDTTSSIAQLGIVHTILDDISKIATAALSTPGAVQADNCARVCENPCVTTETRPKPKVDGHTHPSTPSEQEQDAALRDEIARINGSPQDLSGIKPEDWLPTGDELDKIMSDDSTPSGKDVKG